MFYDVLSMHMNSHGCETLVTTMRSILIFLIISLNIKTYIYTVIVKQRRRLVTMITTEFYLVIKKKTEKADLMAR